MPRCDTARRPLAPANARAPLTFGALCAVSALSALSALLAPAALAQTTDTTTAATTSTDAPPQTVRDFPVNALRGTLLVGMSPQATINDVDTRLAPGARIRGTNNLLVLPGMLSGQKVLVVYTRDTYQLIHDVWILRPEEATLLWPETAEQAAAWTYDPLAHRWSKPN